MSCPYQHGSAAQSICRSIETITGLNARPDWHAADDSIDETLDMWDGTNSANMTKEELASRRLARATTEEALDAAADFFESEGIDPNGPLAEALLNGPIVAGELKMTRGNAANLSTMRRTLNRRRERIADGTGRPGMRDELRDFDVKVQYTPGIGLPDVTYTDTIRAFSEEEAIDWALGDLGRPNTVTAAQAIDVTPSHPCSEEALNDPEWYTRGSRSDAERDVGPGYAILRTTDPNGDSTTLATRLVEVHPDGTTRWEYTAVNTDWQGNEEVYTMADFRSPPALRGQGAEETVRSLHSFFVAHAESPDGSEAAASFPWSQEMSSYLADLVNQHRRFGFAGGYGSI